MSSGITLTAATRQNLLSLQGTADLLTQTQNRLSTGKKVNSALDDPTSFFTSQALSGRSGDLGNAAQRHLERRPDHPDRQPRYHLDPEAGRFGQVDGQSGAGRQERHHQRPRRHRRHRERQQELPRPRRYRPTAPRTSRRMAQGRFDRYFARRRHHQDRRSVSTPSTLGNNSSDLTKVSATPDRVRDQQPDIQHRRSEGRGFGLRRLATGVSTSATTSAGAHAETVRGRLRQLDAGYRLRQRLQQRPRSRP